MLSLGMEYERAFSIAFWSARFPAGSPPPSRAATMIARESLEKSLPRFASAAPFLCLIDDHLLCPDTLSLLDNFQEQLVHARIFRQLGMERGHEQPAVPKEHRRAVVLGEHLDVGADVRDARSPDEDAAQWFRFPGQGEVGLEARDLTPVGVPLDLEVGQTEMIPVEHDHAGTGAEDRRRERSDCLVQAVEPHEAHERRRLASGPDEPVEPLELVGLAHLHGLDPEPSQHRRVLTEIPLHREHSDSHCASVVSSTLTASEG